MGWERKSERKGRESKIYHMRKKTERVREKNFGKVENVRQVN